MKIGHVKWLILDSLASWWITSKVLWANSEGHTHTGETVLSSSADMYSAPEVYYGKAFNASSDIYSIAIILWELVSRCIKGVYERPFSEYTFISFDFQIVSKRDCEWNLTHADIAECTQQFAPHHSSLLSCSHGRYHTCLLGCRVIKTVCLMNIVTW